MISSVKFPPKKKLSFSKLLQDNPEKKPIGLKLERIHFPFTKLKTNWFPVDVPLNYLILDEMNFNGIENGSFNTTQFVSLYELELSKMELPFLTNKVFAGLNYLHKLKLKGVKLLKFEKNVFAVLPKLLEIRIVCANLSPLTMDNLFGSDAIPSMSHLMIEHCNLKDSITAVTFSGLTGILHLTLNHTNIERIGEDSFDVIFQTLKSLTINSNALKTIDVNLFKLNTRKMVLVYLQDNPWHCNCDLDPFREFIQSTKQFKFGNVICRYPRGQVLNNLTSLCHEPMVKLWEMEKPKIEDETQIEIQPIKNGSLINHQSSKKTPLIHMENGQLIISDEYSYESLKLIGFAQESLENGMSIATKCLIKSDEFKILDIKQDFDSNRIYRFCVMKKQSKTIEPQNCVSFDTMILTIVADVWMMMDDKTLFITVFVLCSFLAIIIGISVSFSLAKCCPLKNKWQKTNLAEDEDLSAREYEAVKRFRFVFSTF